MQQPLFVSIVVPIYNEESVLPLLVSRLHSLIEVNKNLRFEIILVNDGSRDKSKFLINEACQNSPFIGIHFSRNFGHLLYPVSIWHGLVPPSVKFVEEGYRFLNFFLSLGYLGLYSLIIFPEFILPQDKRTFFCVSVISLILVFMLPDLRYAPSQFLLERLFGTVITNLVAYCFGIVLVFISLLLVYSIYLQIRKIKKNNDSNVTMYIYYSLVLIAICFSNIKITHQFSSRYITLVLPLLVYIVGSNNFLSKDKLVFYRFTFSFVLSIIFILNYYGLLLP